jgi:hypothetical protein
VDHELIRVRRELERVRAENVRLSRLLDLLGRDTAPSPGWFPAVVCAKIDERGPAALVAAAEVFAVDVSRITSAVSYYGDYGDEIDAEIELAEEASMRAERARSVQQKLIA